MDISLRLLSLVMLTSSAMAISVNSACLPDINCRLPNCRCWDDNLRPGNFTNDGTPQIVSLTFSQAINNHTLRKYLPLFQTLVNPNGCPAKGTFFSQDLDTDITSLRLLHNEGHEVALTSFDGSIPKDRRQWVESLFKSSEKLYDAGIKRDEIKGARAPNLELGGSDELQAEEQFGMLYEASCVVPLEPSSNKDNQMLWPFTYDYVNNVPKCSLGKTPNTSFPGMWQFLLPEMSLRHHRCSTLSSCSPYINTTADAFILLYNSFIRHYYQGRAPLVLNIDPQWLSKEVQVKGLLEFLQVLSRFEDTWLVSLAQALEWVRFPVPMYKTVRFLPWECPKEQKMKYSRYNRRM